MDEVDQLLARAAKATRSIGGRRNALSSPPTVAPSVAQGLTDYAITANSTPPAPSAHTEPANDPLDPEKHPAPAECHERAPPAAVGVLLAESPSCPPAAHQQQPEPVREHLTTRFRMLGLAMHDKAGTEAELRAVQQAVALIKRRGVDLVAVSGVGSRRAGGLNLTRKLAEQSGLVNYSYCAAIDGGGEHALAVLSRWPILEQRTLWFEPRKPDSVSLHQWGGAAVCEPRAARAVLVRDAGSEQPLWFAALNFCAAPAAGATGTAVQQMRQLSDWMRALACSSQTGERVPVIAGGTFDLRADGGREGYCEASRLGLADIRLVGGSVSGYSEPWAVPQSMFFTPWYYGLSHETVKTEEVSDGIAIEWDFIGTYS
jgi:hypothetical protein